MNRGLFYKCLICISIFALCFHASTAEAAHGKKKKSHKPARVATAINQQNPKYASIVIDAETGTILHQDNADALRHPASLTKMMTLLLVFDALDSGRLQPAQRIRISQRAATMPPSKLGLQPGSGIRVDDAISALATESANDIAVALAEAVGGSESEFAKKMNAKAAAIGMSRTRFYNASGLPNDYQVTTARDMARLARYLLTQHPRDSRVFSTLRWSYNGHMYNNHNRLMETYPGMDCCKTGYINASGFNLVASAKRNGDRVIGVVFGGRSTASRNTHMASLLDDGFEKVKEVQIAQANPAQPQKNPQLEKDVMLASVAPERAIMQEAYMNAQDPVQDTAPLQVKKIVPQPVHRREAPAQATAPVTAPAANPLSNPTPAAPVAAQNNAAQSLGTLQVSSLTPNAGTAQLMPNPYSSMAGTAQPAQQTAAIAPANPAPAAAMPAANNGWSIQIGAYQTRLATDQAIWRAQQKLPNHLKKSQPVVVPLRTTDASWMFRARLSGFTQSEATEACKYFKDCLTISPQAY